MQIEHFNFFAICLPIISVHRAETVRSALDVLCICAVMPRVQLHLCERVDLPDETMTVGMNVILGAAEGEIVADPDVQRAALGVLITCVCAPINRVLISSYYFFFFVVGC